MDQDYLDLRKWLDDTKDEPLESMAGFFDVRIGDYEAHMARWKNHYQWIAELLPASVKTLLDVGCGSGLELDCIFRRFPTLCVTGVDLSERMLAKLDQKHGGKNLRLVRDDYFHYDMGENCFDAAIAFETLHHVGPEKKAALFSKIARCLKPGGVYLECDYIASAQAIEDMVFEECARRRRRDGIPEDAFVHFDTPLTLEHEMQAMRQGGFQTVELVGFLPEDNHTPMIRCMK